MQKTRLTLLFTCFIMAAVAQTDYARFKKLYSGKDTAKTRAFLMDWELRNPNDPEIYTSAINFYFNGAQKEELSFDREPKADESFQLTDSSGKATAFISSRITYDRDKLARAFHYAGAGIARFPDRLDIRFGKCYLLKEVGDYDNFVKELIRTIEYSQINQHKWLWSENQKEEDGKKVFLETVYSYQRQLYETEEDSLLTHLVAIGDATLKYYPEEIPVLSITSVALLLKEEYDKAIEYLKKAERVNPKDVIVLNNIAHAYTLKADKPNAIRYYELVEKYGDSEAKQNAREKLKELRK
jgi:tetratricopeptide (TPR) repeat protein